MDGRRAGPAGTRGGTSSLDFNVNPLIAIDRIEILKDGASSIYGSDAIAGVVNIIMREGEGGTVNACIGVPTHGGGTETRISALPPDRRKRVLIGSNRKQSATARENLAGQSNDVPEELPDTQKAPVDLAVPGLRKLLGCC